VIVWACFTDERLGLLIICDERGIEVDKYIDILYDSLFSLIDDLLQPPEDPNMIQVTDEHIFLFMQGNTKVYKATKVIEFLIENHIPVMEWLAQLPDLNPIENLWTDFKAHFYKQFLELFNYASKSLEARYHYGEVL